MHFNKLIIAAVFGLATAVLVSISVIVTYVISLDPGVVSRYYLSFRPPGHYANHYRRC